MNRDPSTIAVQAEIGAPFEGGFYGGVVRLGGGLLYAVVWAPKAQGETTGAWLESGDDVPGARSCADSLGNTLALAEAGSKLAKWALDLRIGGLDDWCLPSRDVLELAYRHMKPTKHKTGNYFRDGDNPTSVPPGYPYASGKPIAQTGVAVLQEGGSEAFDAAWYWSSSQYSAGFAWYQNFSNGFQGNISESYEGRCRAVRLIQVTA